MYFLIALIFATPALNGIRRSPSIHWASARLGLHEADYTWRSMSFLGIICWQYYKDVGTMNILMLEYFDTPSTSTIRQEFRAHQPTRRATLRRFRGRCQRKRAGIRRPGAYRRRRVRRPKRLHISSRSRCVLRLTSIQRRVVEDQVRLGVGVGDGVVSVLRLLGRGSAGVLSVVGPHKYLWMSAAKSLQYSEHPYSCSHADPEPAGLGR